MTLKEIIRGRLILLLLVVLFVVGCATPEPIVVTSTLEPVVVTATPGPLDEVSVYMEWLKGIYQRWDDAIAIANSAPRITLSGPVAGLQEVRREAANFEIGDPRLAVAHEKLVEGMDYAIDAYMLFMADPDGDTEYLFGLYESRVGAFLGALLRIDFVWEYCETITNDMMICLARD